MTPQRVKYLFDENDQIKGKSGESRVRSEDGMKIKKNRNKHLVRGRCNKGRRRPQISEKNNPNLDYMSSLHSTLISQSQSSCKSQKKMDCPKTNIYIASTIDDINFPKKCVPRVQSFSFSSCFRSPFFVPITSISESHSIEQKKYFSDSDEFNISPMARMRAKNNDSTTNNIYDDASSYDPSFFSFEANSFHTNGEEEESMCRKNVKENDNLMKLINDKIRK